MTGAACGRQTHRQDVVGESDGLRQLQQADVVVGGSGVVVGMVDDLRHAAAHFVGVRALLLLAAQVQRQGAGGGAGLTHTHTTQALVIGTGSSSSTAKYKFLAGSSTRVDSSSI